MLNIAKKHTIFAVALSAIASIVLSAGIVFAAVTISTNIQMGGGTPNLTLNGDDAYITGTLEADGQARLDGTVLMAGNVIIGTGEASSTPVGNTIRAPNASGTNIAGANLTIAAGVGTGNATPGQISFQFATPGSSGTTAQSLSTAMQLLLASVGLANETRLALGPTGQTYTSGPDGQHFPAQLYGANATIAYNDAGLAVLDIGGSTSLTFSVTGSQNGRIAKMEMDNLVILQSAGAITIPNVRNLDVRMPSTGADVTITNAIGIDFSLGQLTPLGTTTNFIPINIADTSNTSTNQYGIKIGNLTSGSSKDYGVFVGGADTAAFAASGAQGTTNQAILAENTSNNSAALENAYFEAKVGGTTTAGDPHIRFTIPSGTSWYAGPDNSSSDRFTVGTGTTVGGTDYYRIDPTLTGATSYAQHVFVRNPITTTAGSNPSTATVSIQNGSFTDSSTGTGTNTSLSSNLSVGSIVVNGGGGVVTFSKISTGSFTLPGTSGNGIITDSSGIRVVDQGGSTGTSTNQYGLYIEALTQGTNNYGIYVNTPTGTKAEAIHVVGGNSYLGGPLRVANASTTLVGSATTTLRVDTTSTTQGTCLALKTSTGSAVWARIEGTSWVITTTSCE